MAFDIDKLILKTTTDNLPIVLGKSSSLTLSAKNQNESDWAYNLSIHLTLSDGLELFTSDMTFTSVTKENDKITYNWINIRDLAPLELDFSFSVSIGCKEKFKDNTEIPFDYILKSQEFNVSVDTMPRGNSDIGNIEYQKSVLFDVITTRYSINKTIPLKCTKGAGSSPERYDYLWPYQCKLTFINNTREATIINITDTLGNGIRFIGDIKSSGTDAPLFEYYIIIPPDEIENSTKIKWNSLMLSINSYTEVTYKCAIWDKYTENAVENSGSTILHKSPIETILLSESIYGILSIKKSILAMDITIDKGVNKSNIDVDDLLLYTLLYKLNQYHDIGAIKIYDLLPDGQNYLDSITKDPDIIEKNQKTGITTITWNIGILQRGSSGELLFRSNVTNTYTKTLNPVYSGDSMTNESKIEGLNASFISLVNDTSNKSMSIKIPTVTKEIVSVYYKDGTKKDINSLSPGDKIQFILKYDAKNIKAKQKNIVLDDFFPFMISDILDIDYQYFGYIPLGLTPKSISPYGVRWEIGDVPGQNNIEIDFLANISYEAYEVTFYSNLFKMSGINTNNHSFSDRAQVEISMGFPNITLIKTVNGPNINAIKAREEYTYTVTLRNLENSSNNCVDAFDFALDDLISDELILNTQSVIVSGSGVFDVPIITNDSIKVNIRQLKVNQEIILTYKVIVKDTIVPDMTLDEDAKTTEPYSQPYDTQGQNFQYTGTIKYASAPLKSQNISLIKTYDSGKKMVGSNLNYVLTTTIPQGSKAYSFFIYDDLPVTQDYLGNPKKNGEPTQVTISGQRISFKEEEIIDALTSPVTIFYSFEAKIINASYKPGQITTNQNNKIVANYKSITEEIFTKNVGKNVSVNNPNIVLDFSADNKTTLSPKYFDILQFKLNSLNNSNIGATKIIITCPIPDILDSIEIVSSGSGVASYDEISNTIIWNIPKILSKLEDILLFRASIKNAIYAGTYIEFNSSTQSYYNEIEYDKVYSGNISNDLSINFTPLLTFLPKLPYRQSEIVAVVRASRKVAADIGYNLVNSGNGIDSYSIYISAFSYAYKLFINKKLIEKVDPYTELILSPTELSNIYPNTMKEIELVISIPESPLDIETYNITISSLSLPNLQKTILTEIIDP